MKDLGQVDTLLDIKVRKYNGGYALCQNYYIDKMLNKFQYLKIREVNITFDPNLKCNENLGRPIAQLEYASAIGSLTYTMNCA